MTVRLRTIAREWGRIGVIGFGGPPAHIALLRDLCVTRRGWLDDAEFTDGIAVTNLLPGPASTQLAIWCAWRLRGWRGALVGGTCFILPGLVVIIGLAGLFLSARPPRWVLAAAAGAGAAVPAVALHAAAGLIPASWRAASAPAASGRPSSSRAASGPEASGPAASGWGGRARWVGYGVVGAAVSALAGPWVVLALLAAGLCEVIWRGRARGSGPRTGARRNPRAGLGRHFRNIRRTNPPDSPGWPGALPALAGAGVLGSVAWVALKVGALSYGGGFVIIPLMQHDAVQTHHWMTGSQFLTAVALGQVTPGPVVLTVAVVGFAAAGYVGALLAAFVAFAPSFAFVLLGAHRFDALRANARVRAFLGGAGPAAIGAIAGATIPLVGNLSQLWQLGVLAAAAIWLLALRRGVVTALVGAAAVGVVAVLAGAPL